MREGAVGSIYVPDYCASPLEVTDQLTLQMAWFFFEGMVQKIAARDGRMPALVGVDGRPLGADADVLVEALAALEHDQWIYWTQNLAATGAIAPERVERWKPQWIPYAELTEENKEYDRVWARKAIAIFGKVLGVES